MTTTRHIGELFESVLASIGVDRQLSNTAPTVRMTENGRTIAADDGFWAWADSLTACQTVTDEATGQAGMIGAVVADGEPVMVGLRVAASGGLITEVETLVSRDGESSIFDAAAYVPGATVGAPVAQQATRSELVATADRYFSDIENNEALSLFDPGCERFENGVVTTGNPAVLQGADCPTQFAMKVFIYITEVRGRRYPVVDPTTGTVLSMAFLDVPGTVTHLRLPDGREVELPERMLFPRSTLLFELFKIDEGQIQRIEVSMVNLPFGAPHGWE